MTERRTRPGSIGPRLRTLTAAAALTLPLALLTTAIGSASQPNTQQSSHPVSAAAATAAMSDLVAPGVNAAGTQLTLITGNQVTLTPTGKGDHHFSVDLRPIKGASPLSGFGQVISLAAKNGVRFIDAVPGDAEPFIIAGTLDRGLFDVNYLANHDTGGKLTVDVQYASAMTSAQLATRTAALKGGTMVKALNANTAQVSVNLADAATFWSAITGSAPTATRLSTALADGITSVWLDGHRVGPGTVAATPATTPLYTITEILRGSTNAATCNQTSGPWCFGGTIADVLGVTGPEIDNFVAPTGETCADTACDTLDITFQVPAGIYSMFTTSIERFDNADQTIAADDPEFRVANNVTLTADLNAAAPVVINTPDPTQSYGGSVLGSNRILPDGTDATDQVFGLYGNDGQWVVPSKPVTIGNYFITSNYVMGAVPVTMSVTSPQQTQLDPLYPEPEEGAWRFPQGKQTLQVVDAGAGLASDFAKINAKGKLVLINNSDNTGNCTIDSTKLQNAVNAGAVGVLQDPRLSGAVGGVCPIPMPAEYFFPGDGPAINMPVVTLSPQNVMTLTGLLATGGAVKITLNDTGPTPYEYDLAFVHNGEAPASETHNLTRSQLAYVQANYHQLAQPSIIQLDQESTSAGDQVINTPIDTQLPPTPSSRRIYFGPISPEILWVRYVKYTDPNNVGDILSAQQIETAYYQAGDNGTEDWGDVPTAPGLPLFTQQVLTAQSPIVSADRAACSGCRMGNDFTAWFYLTEPNPLIEGLDPVFDVAGIDPNSEQLYQNGQLLPQVGNAIGASEYTLSPNPANYRLVLNNANSQTTWDFTSAASTQNTAPTGYGCPSILLGFTGPCQPVPLIFLRYDAGIGLSNTLPAPGVHQVTITTSRLDPTAPAITSLQVWTSVDGGKTWAPASTVNHHGSYVASYVVPQVSATDGAVSIKVTAKDAGGNDITQVITDAIPLAQK